MQSSYSPRPRRREALVGPFLRSSSRRLGIVLVALVLACLTGCGAGYKSVEAAAPSSGGYAPAAETGVAQTESLGFEDSKVEGVATAREASDSDAIADAPRRAPPAPAAAPVPLAPAATPPASPDKKTPSASDAPTPQPGTPPPPSGPAPGALPDVVKPLLIYSATVTLAVFETKKTLDAAEKLAKELGGYLVRRDDRSIVIRIPAGKFDGSLDEIGKLGDLLHRDVSVRDVTEEFFDMSTRLRNFEVVRERLEELLKKAGKVEEALAVERELQRVTQEIERIKGRLKLYRELIAFSTITINLAPRSADNIDSTVRMPFSWLGQLGLGSLLRL